MICSNCIHAIQRTYSNGPQIKYVKHYCDIDGQEIGPQIADCSRLEERAITSVVCLHHATLEAGGTIKDGKCIVCSEDVLGNLKAVLKERADAMLPPPPDSPFSKDFNPLPPLKEVAKKRGRRK